MHLPVPQPLQAVILSGNTALLAEIREANQTLTDLRAKAEAAIDQNVANVMANGIAHGQITNGQSARVVILANGSLVVEVSGNQAAPPVVSAKSKATAASNAVKTPGLVGPAAYPPIGELRVRAAAVGADLTGINPQNKRDILAAIEKAENAVPASVPTTADEPVVEGATSIDNEADVIDLDGLLD